MFKFTEEQLAKYRDIKPPFGMIGAPTYKRTYSRPIYDENGKMVDRESWLDTIARVIEGNVNLGIENGDPTATPEWAEEALEYMFHMGVMPPGRGYWMMGTEYAYQRGGDALNNCFRKGTLVHTEKGVVPIEQLVGKTVKVLSQDGKYREATFKSYGVQPLMRVEFGNGDVVYATPEHQWLLWDEKGKKIRTNRVFTKDLKRGHIVPLNFPEDTENLVPDVEGVAHGFVYGDGTINTYKVKDGIRSYALVRFPNEVKRKYLFDLVKQFGTDKYDWQVPAVIHLPVGWKSVPEPEHITREYALGFIVGLISADGYVRESISIHQADKEELEKIRRLAMWVGLKTSPVRMDREISPYTGEVSPMYVFTISTASLHKDLLIRADQKDKWKCKKGKIQRTTSIKKVEYTAIEEEVYCCEEMETHTMTIESGILTGQCWYVSVRPQSYEDIEMFKDQPYIFSDPWKEMPSYPFVFMFDRAMLGGGVGFGASRKNLELMPKVTTEVDLKIFLHPNHPDWERIMSSEEWSRIKDFIITDTEVAQKAKDNGTYYFATDNREGWNISVRETIDGHFIKTELVKNKVTLVIDLSRIRPYGAQIKGFGGTASGPLPLISALVEVNRILNARVGKRITSEDTLDIMNLLGRCVVAGNVRRTALIALGDADDPDYVNAKNYKLVEPIMEKDENGYTIWETNKWGRMTQRRKSFDVVVQELLDKKLSEFYEDGRTPSDEQLAELQAKAEEEANRLFELAWKQENHRWSSNNSVYTYEMFKDHHFIAAGIIANGEPGVGNEWLMKNFGRIKDGFKEAVDRDAEGLNPCFRGDMKLLTVDGYKTFEELDGTEPLIINKDGIIVKGKVWCSGVKDIVEVKFLNRDSIFVTPDHVFMLTDGSECQAKDLKGKRIMPFLTENYNHDSEFVKLGFILGDGTFRITRGHFDGVDVNVGKKDKDVCELFGNPKLQSNGRVFFTTEFNDLLEQIGINPTPVYNRSLPSTYSEWTDSQKLGFLRGLYSANGSVLKGGRITYKTTSEQLAYQLVEALSEFGIYAYVTVNNPRDMEWHNGTYTSTQSYDVNVQKYESRLEFYRLIGFVQRYKHNKLRTTLIETAPMVCNVVECGREKVYDFTEPLTHWGVVEGVIAHNCAEITLWNCEPCNLVEFVPYMCMKFDLDFKKALRIATQYAYRVTFAKYIWKATARVIAQNRRIGVSLTGMQDYFLAKYGHYAVKGFEIDPETGKEDITKPIFYQEIVDELDEWYRYVREVNTEHARLMGANQSIKVTTVKPSGTVAKLPGVSSGIHWHYSPYMIQRIRFHETDPNLKVLEACGFPIEKSAKEPNTMVVEFPIKNPNADHPNFLGAGDIPLEVQFANQYLFAYAWADNAVSATLTFKFDEVDKIEPLLKAYNNRIKSTSLLPYSGHGYVQAPWEPITKEEYERRVAELKATPEEMYKLIPIVVEAEEEVLDSDCLGGGCPIK